MAKRLALGALQMRVKKGQVCFSGDNEALTGGLSFTNEKPSSINERDDALGAAPVGLVFGSKGLLHHLLLRPQA